jgi:hypothetical protein
VLPFARKDWHMGSILAICFVAEELTLVASFDFFRYERIEIKKKENQKDRRY